MNKYDFEIGQYEGYDDCYDWILPFNLMVDWSATGFRTNNDGDDIFEIVAFSKNMLTGPQKDEIKKNIESIVYEAKDKIKTLYLKHYEKQYFVQYDRHSVGEREYFLKLVVEFKILDQYKIW